MLYIKIFIFQRKTAIHKIIQITYRIKYTTLYDWFIKHLKSYILKFLKHINIEQK